MFKHDRYLRRTEDQLYLTINKNDNTAIYFNYMINYLVLKLYYSGITVLKIDKASYKMSVMQRY